MLLTEADIARLEKHGISRETFMRSDSEGYAMLRNRQGHCVFYNPQEKRCDVYELRPEGCTVYPVIFDEDCGGVVLDSICPAQASIEATEKSVKGAKVIEILKRIDEEALVRRMRK
jgi:Fe-S-cluster containining protein